LFEFGKLLSGKKVYQILEVLSNCIKSLILITAKTMENTALLKSYSDWAGISAEVILQVIGSGFTI
jgi:hypothetical protein